MLCKWLILCAPALLAVERICSQWTSQCLIIYLVSEKSTAKLMKNATEGCKVLFVFQGLIRRPPKEKKKTFLINSVDFELDFLVSPHSVNCMHLSFPLLCFNVIARLQQRIPGESSMPISKSCFLLLPIEIIF